MVRLHVNIDHVATLRQARRGFEPDPVEWALAAEKAGAEGITFHLRKDRRHIQDADVRALRTAVTTLLNFELSLAPGIVDIALDVGAEAYCLVPENRKEVTTEGGLDVVREAGRLAAVIPRLIERGGAVSLFIDPDVDQVKASADAGAAFVELHTGAYAEACHGGSGMAELQRLEVAALTARELGLRVNAGHGLNYDNVREVAALPGVEELNIGHSIVSRSVFTGVAEAIGTMKRLIAEGAEG